MLANSVVDMLLLNREGLGGPAGEYSSGSWKITTWCQSGHGNIGSKRAGKVLFKF